MPETTDDKHNEPPACELTAIWQSGGCLHLITSTGRLVCRIPRTLKIDLGSSTAHVRRELTLAEIMRLTQGGTSTEIGRDLGISQSHVQKRRDKYRAELAAAGIPDPATVTRSATEQNPTPVIIHISKDDSAAIMEAIRSPKGFRLILDAVKSARESLGIAA
jgi:hypothetical protein